MRQKANFSDYWFDNLLIYCDWLEDNQRNHIYSVLWRSVIKHLYLPIFKSNDGYGHGYGYGNGYGNHERKAAKHRPHE